jgi:redox-sensitive bicupin YhaK (pirin superfamily)
MTEPKYQELPASSLGKYISEDQTVRMNVIAGEYQSIKGPAYTFSPMNLFDVRMDEAAIVEFDFPENYNTAILIIEGSIQINHTHIVLTDQFILFENRGTDIHISAEEKSVILVMSGEPINEPIYPYGPFLMNTQDEIQQAYEEYYAGKFGHLDD